MFPGIAALRVRYFPNWTLFSLIRKGLAGDVLMILILDNGKNREELDSKRHTFSGGPGLTEK
jgi:hypothetical protein